MYPKVNSKLVENHFQILQLFTQGTNKEYFVREVHRELDMSLRTAQRGLEFLEKKGVLRSLIRGKIKSADFVKNFSVPNHSSIPSNIIREIF